MTTTRPHTNRDDVSDLERLRKEYRNWWSATEGWTRLEGAQKADALITALEAEVERANELCIRDLEHTERLRRGMVRLFHQPRDVRLYPLGAEEASDDRP